MTDKPPSGVVAEREDCPQCKRWGTDQTCPLCNGRGFIDPPLTCAYCFARRWNDGTVRWLPLRGLYREPYCAGTCAVWVMTEVESVRNGGAEVWKALLGVNLDDL